MEKVWKKKFCFSLEHFPVVFIVLGKCFFLSGIQTSRNKCGFENQKPNKPKYSVPNPSLREFVLKHLLLFQNACWLGQQKSHSFSAQTRN